MGPDSSQPLILHISSDEEEEEDVDVFGVRSSDYEWVSSLLNDDEVDGDHDVAVLTELLANPRKKKKVDDDDDDECVILDDDPSNKNTALGVNNHGGSEDLLILAEKGQIACRDYPHPRHICAKFPFASTPHNQHCHQCHCYVCDSLAPCIYWGTGTSNIDHCHSNQDPFWKAQRENFRKCNKVPLLNPQLPSTPVLPPLPQAMDQNQITRLAAIGACAAFKNYFTRNMVHPRPSSHSSSWNGFNPSLVSQHLLGSFNNNAKLNMSRQSPSNLGAQHLNRPRMFKRQGSNEVVPPNMNKYLSEYARNLTRQPVVTGTYSQQNSLGSSMSLLPPYQPQVTSQPQPFNTQFNSFVNSQPNLTSFQNQTPFQSQLFSPLKTGLNNLGNLVTCQAQVSGQPKSIRGLINHTNIRMDAYNHPSYLQQGNEAQSATSPCSSTDATI